MTSQKKTLPSRQAMRSARKSNQIVSHETAGGIVLTALVIFTVLVLPRIIYALVAPTQGWF